MASIRKRGDTFTITAYFGYDEQNRQIKKTTTYHPPEGVTSGKAEKLAKQYAATWEDKIRGYVSLDENRTFRDLAQWYYEVIAPQVLKLNVLLSNKRAVENYIMPTLGNVKLKNITPVMLDSLLAELKNNGGINEYYKLKDVCLLKDVSKYKLSDAVGISWNTLDRAAKGGYVTRVNAEKLAAHFGKQFGKLFVANSENNKLSPVSISRIKNCTSAIFTAGVKREILRRNPCDNVITQPHSRMASSFLDKEQAVKLLSVLDSHKDLQFRTMVTTLLLTGMRAGELLGLKWSDIDEENRIIYIRRTLVYNAKYKENNVERRSLQTPKTKASERYVKIPVFLLDLLKQHKQEQDVLRGRLGNLLYNRGTIFVNTEGDYYSGVYLNKKFRQLCAEHGFPPGTHIHTLRHTAASLLVNADVSPKLIAEQLGHKVVHTTLDIYSHVFMSSKAKTMEVLEDSLLSKKEN